MNVEQSDLGPQYGDTVYNTMKYIYDKDDSAQV